jgi:hypothetical protein
VIAYPLTVSDFHVAREWRDGKPSDFFGVFRGSALVEGGFGTRKGARDWLHAQVTTTHADYLRAEGIA